MQPVRAVRCYYTLVCIPGLLPRAEDTYSASPFQRLSTDSAKRSATRHGLLGPPRRGNTTDTAQRPLAKRTHFIESADKDQQQRALPRTSRARHATRIKRRPVTNACRRLTARPYPEGSPRLHQLIPAASMQHATALQLQNAATGKPAHNTPRKRCRLAFVNTVNHLALEQHGPVSYHFV